MDIKNKILEANTKINIIKEEISKVIVGQENLIRDILIWLLAKGHILLEGPPGLAKTLSVATLAQITNLWFQRIQFTPDLLPSDLIWVKIFHQDTKEFSVKKWPIFSNLVLADEINRAPSKVQSALLEAMAEKQVTIGDQAYSLAEPFTVLATMNPIEQDGTYSLPEAQLDRFLIKSIISYPTDVEEIAIMKQETTKQKQKQKLQKVVSKKEILELQNLAMEVFVDDTIYEYVKNITLFTRNDDIAKNYLTYGASPRASIALIKTAKVLAMLSGRDFVIPEDIKEMAYLVLRHRIILSYEMIAEWVTPDMVIEDILNRIEIT